VLDRRRGSIIDLAPAVKAGPRADISEILADQFRNFPAADLLRRIEARKDRVRSSVEVTDSDL
jgi:hypothetical protein